MLGRDSDDEDAEVGLVEGGTSYLDALNTVVSVMRDLQRPIVLRGFLHSHDCLTYWHYDSDSLFERKACYIHPSVEIIQIDGPEIYICESPDTADQFRHLNLEIRTNELHRLEYDTYSKWKKVGNIKEFNVVIDNFYSFKADDLLQIPLVRLGC